jgi:hypothetical protein
MPDRFRDLNHDTCVVPVPRNAPPTPLSRLVMLGDRALAFTPDERPDRSVMADRHGYGYSLGYKYSHKVT